MAGRGRLSYRAAWTIALAALAALILLGSAYPVARASARVEINFNEGWNAYRQAQAAGGIPLYAAPPRYSVTNYPPLSFHLVGWLGALTGDFNAAGRYVSLLSLAAIAGFVAAMVREFAPPRAAAFAALAFLAWIAAAAPGRIGMNDPQLLATAVSVAALYLYLKRARSPAWLCGSAILFAVSLFIKHNLLAFPAAAGAHLLLTRSWRRFALWSGAMAAGAAAALWFTLRIDGSYFFAHLTAPRTASGEQALIKIEFYLICCGMGAVIAAVWCRRNARKPGRNLLVLAVIAAHAIAVVFSAGSGVDMNIFFDGIVVLSMIVAIAIADLERSGHAASELLVVALAAFLFPAGLTAHEAVADARAWAALPRLESEFRQTTALIAGQPGPAFCGDPLICFAAGKEEGISMFFVSEQIKLGKIRESEITDRIERHEFSTIEVPVSSTIDYGANLQRSIARWYRPALRSTKYTVMTPRLE